MTKDSTENANLARMARKMGVIDIESGLHGEVYRLTSAFKEELLRVVGDVKSGGRLSAISEFPEDERDRAIILMALVRFCGIAIDPQVCCVSLFLEAMVKATIDRELGPVDWKDFR